MSDRNKKCCSGPAIIKGTTTKSIRKYAKEYCSLTSIHGCRYLGEDRTVFEKVWWAVILTVSLICCVLMINRIYLKWKSSPVIVTFATTETPIHKLPFPAVTICPESKIKSTTLNYTKAMYDDDENSRKEAAFKYFSLICDQRGYEDPNEASKTYEDEFYDVIAEGTPDYLNEGLAVCIWLGTYHSCNKIFTPIVTDEGICYTFNMLDRSDFYTAAVQPYRDFHNISMKLTNWNTGTFQYFKDDTVGDVSYPFRAYLAGAKVAFSVVLITKEQDVDYLCKESMQGYRVLLHHPANVPQLSERYFRVPLDQSVIAAVNPTVVTTSQSVKHYSPKDRNCYFSHERKLKFFKVYTQDNCNVECQANITEILCNCTAYHMPRENGTKICGLGSLQCLRRVEDVLLAFKTVDYLDEEEQLLEGLYPIDLETGCDCLPGCSYMDYAVELSQSDWNWRKMFDAHRLNYKDLFGNETKNYYVSKFDVFLKTNHIIGLERHELYGPTDFIANFGGLLGLFTGFSIISFVEIVYFLTVRLLCNLLRMKNE